MKCGGHAIADTYEEAKNLINHAVGLGRGIKCGDNYNMVQEIKSIVANNTPKEVVKNIPKSETPKTTKSSEKPFTSEKPKTKQKSSV